MASPTSPLAVALIAGGRSTRMGQDKARLPMPTGGELWQDRLDLLKQCGTSEVMISCRRDQDFSAESGVNLVFDQHHDAGPMGGIVSCLQAMHSEWLLVLGVDLPGVTHSILLFLIEAMDKAPDTSGRSPQGVVFRRGKFLEPLLAIYPKSMAASGQQRLAAGKLALKDWILAEEPTAPMRVLNAPAEWDHQLENINDPASWKRWISQNAKLPPQKGARGSSP